MSIKIINDKKSFKNIFRDNWAKFKQKYSSYNDEHYNQAVQKMLDCGDEGNGYTEYRCTKCGEGVRRIAFTCKSVFCLSCGKVYSDSVVAQVSKTLHLGVSYRHIVLTVPEQLRQFFYNNRKRKEVYSGLMKAGYECLEEVVSVVKKQSVKIGTIVVIHTHGRSGIYNPHIHVIATDGGINEKGGKWVNLGYIPYETLRKKWQYHLLSMIKEGCDKKTEKEIDMLWKKYPEGFVSHVSKGRAPEHSAGLAKYLAKYIASPPISVRRLIGYGDDSVSYYYKDHRTKESKIETVPIETFIGRMVQHILPKGFQRIRYYGLQATKSFNKWCDTIREGLRKIGKVVKGAYQIVRALDYRGRYIEAFGKDPCLCGQCKSIMTLWRIWHPKYGLLYCSIDSG